jgi:hypothetical protein
VIAVLAGTLGAGVAAEAAAQETGTPVFLSPYRTFERHSIGVTVSDPGPGVAIEGDYRFGFNQHDLGVRVGFLDHNDDTVFLVGGSYRARVITHSRDFPLDGAFTVGLGIQAGDGFTQGLVPAGISLGRQFDVEDSNVNFVPYVHPNVVFAFGDADEDLLFTLGIGVDVRIAKNLDVRVAGALFDYEGISIGVNFIR